MMNITNQNKKKFYVTFELRIFSFSFSQIFLKEYLKLELSPKSCTYIKYVKYVQKKCFRSSQKQ